MEQAQQTTTDIIIVVPAIQDYEEDYKDIANDICPICHEDITSPKVTLECGHVLHEECFHDYVAFEAKHKKVSILCPLCRLQVLEVEPLEDEALEGDDVEGNVEENVETGSRTAVDDYPRGVRGAFRCLVETGILRMVVCTCIEMTIVGVVIGVAYHAGCGKRYHC